VKLRELLERKQLTPLKHTSSNWDTVIDDPVHMTYRHHWYTPDVSPDPENSAWGDTNR
jgi:hypothetical protein